MTVAPTTGMQRSGGLVDSALRLALRLASPPGAGGRLSILIFHRVLAEPDPLFPDEPDKRRFDEICGWLARSFNVLALDEAVARLAQRSLPARALAITFDDGYADNHDLAMPILRAHGLTATFFIATGFLEGGRMWNDTVIEALRRFRGETLDLSGLGVAGIGNMNLSTLAARRVAVRHLLGSAKYLPPRDRLTLSDRIADRVGAALPGDLMMNPAKVRAMIDGGMQIGAHTVNHPILARIGEAEAADEITRSKADLQAIIGHPVTLFAYPNGRPQRDYLARDVELVRRAGFLAAVSTASGAACDGGGPFELPRFTPWDRERVRFGVRIVRNLFASVATAAV